MGRIYGIDLGTTYSCIAYVDESGRPVVVTNSEGQLTTPSVVFFESPSNFVVGQAAKEQAELQPERVISMVKRHMGVGGEKAEGEGPDGEPLQAAPAWSFEFGGKTFLAQDVSSFIIRKLISDAEAVTGDKVTDVVITCPAYFGPVRIRATQEAGELAGLRVHYVIPEPTAAAIAYGMEQQTEDQVVLVFDLGGGTFDVTVIEIKSDAITVIATGGDHNLGGRNWDEVLANWFAEQFSNHTGVPPEELTSELETWQELILAAERAKVALSSRDTFTYGVRHGADRVVVELTRNTFDEMTQHLLERAISLTESLLEVARGKGYAKIDKLLLVGGATYMPQVISAAKERFGLDTQQYDPNQAVAKGAALFGFKTELWDKIVTGFKAKTGKTPEEAKGDDASGKDFDAAIKETADEYGLPPSTVRGLVEKKVSNVTSKSFGIVVMDPDAGEQVVNLVIVDDRVPHTVSRRFGTYEDQQEGAMLVCMENLERVRADEGTLPLDSSSEIGRAELHFAHPLPKGSPVEITFALGADGLLSVHGKDLTTGREIQAEFTTEAIRTAEDVEEAKGRNLAIQVS
jgi:molecular chaperone DnaK